MAFDSWDEETGGNKFMNMARVSPQDLVTGGGTKRQGSPMAQI